MLPSRRAGLAAGLLLIGTLGIAARQAPSERQQPNFKSGVQLVEVDVRVFDRDGRFVPGLTRSDFELVEDGVPQKIEAMLLVGGPGPAAAEPAPAQPTASDTQEPSGRQTWIFFFDLEHLTPGAGFDRARTAVEDFIRKRFREGDVAGILAGDKMVNNRLTSVRQELLESVKQVKPRSDSRTRYIEMTREWPRLLNEEEALRIARGEREPLQRAVTRACGDDPQQCEIADSAVRQKGITIGGDLQRASLTTLRSLNGLASGLARMPGPKSVVLLSNGFVAQEVESTVRSVVGQIARAGGRVYAIDVRGLDRAGQSNLIDQPQVESPAGPGTRFDSLADGASSVAVDTGGMMIRNENNIGRALDTIADDAGRYYVLAYQPANLNFDGKYREIRVRVNREGVRVRARSGYLALPPSRMLLPQPIKPPDSPGEIAVPEGPPLKAVPGLTSDTGGGASSLAAASGVVAGSSDPAGLPPSVAPAGFVAPGSSEATHASVRLRPDTEARIRALSARDSRETGDGARRGWEAYQRGDIETAERELKSAAARADAPWVHYALGMSRAGLGRVDEAIASWERVRTAVPDFAPVYMDLADTYAAKSDLTSALAIVREAEKRWPKSAEVQSAIGVIHVRRGAIDEGIEALEKTAALTPEDGLAFLNLGRAYALRFHRGRRYVTSQRRWVAQDGDRDKAMEALRKCVALGGPYATTANAELSVLEWSRQVRP